MRDEEERGGEEGGEIRKKGRELRLRIFEGGGAGEKSQLRTYT
jgi:hypothetical protein